MLLYFASSALHFNVSIPFNFILPASAYWRLWLLESAKSCKTMRR